MIASGGLRRSWGKKNEESIEERSVSNSISIKWISVEQRMKKSDLLEGLREKNRQWEALLGSIDPARMEQPGANGDWSMKDLIAHLTGWNHRLVHHLQAALRGEPEPPPPWPAHLHDEDAINAWIYETNRGRSLRAILEETRQVNQRILALMESLPEDAQVERVEPYYYLVWIGGTRFPPGEFFDHFQDDHAANVRAWLAE